MHYDLPFRRAFIAQSGLSPPMLGAIWCIFIHAKVKREIEVEELKRTVVKWEISSSQEEEEQQVPGLADGQLGSNDLVHRRHLPWLGGAFQKRNCWLLWHCSELLFIALLSVLGSRLNLT